ncbi:polysaccharide biosynthesis protein CapD [Methylorubrum populi BJ001]|jgi:O-antigen biosynthesis protein WbqV|uniref:Polysaccharide biosynthesis protein CapD n=1 Tax=Methylorubrum populi (strain ATCC BAA-705 / NCIMB 13946 / BJ001) TaxID=441620 RepID=B1ZKG9_METPB|nr:polysaccharide biosynthesis protein [Methylorubrum populi]ACB80161.1 polysaccharide biosynthesis protein CapD [Methylorubrum populi BJ001]OAH17152.1 capsular biosynthesis protein [Methylorubrum populi]PZP68511.1 MAG: polysaccharide biosynthesis protein [Methylorubrum populi]
MQKRTLKTAVMVVHDLAATAAAVVLTFVFRFQDGALAERLQALPLLLPPFLAYAGLIYAWFRLYRTKWRFASLPDLAGIVRAASVTALTLLVLDYVLVSSNLYGFYFFGKVAIALYWVLQIFLLGGPRLAFRYLKYARSRQSQARAATTPTLLLGRGTDIEIVLRAIESGSVKRLSPKGILSPRADEAGQMMRGVPVLGGFRDLEQVVADLANRGLPVRRLVATPSALAPESEPDDLIARARRLGLPLARVTSLGEGMRDAELAPLEIEDLLLRPTVAIDRPRLENFLTGARVVVTGGGGSIGSEICARAIAFGAAALLVIENSEPALHAVLNGPALLHAEAEVQGALADIRDRERLHAIIRDFRPTYVFHAAALKQVPYLERDWAEGIKTNVFGSINVAEATVAAGARALVMISTDKAIEPVSQLGVTKRFAEMVAQSLDAERAGPEATRLIAVRFGNVLGSAGSVVPVFKAQIARGGPVTVTHAEMVRYFMTVREASDLVLTAASHADAEGRGDTGDQRAAVYVLKMGQPVRIRDLAERMIRLAGFEPGEDIEIQVTGARPGERLNEILFAKEEPRVTLAGIDGVMAAKPVFADRAVLETWILRLRDAVAAGDRAAADAVFEEAIPDFRNRAGAVPNAQPGSIAPPAQAAVAATA